MGGAEGHGLSRAESYADVLQDAIVYGSKARGDWNDDSDIDVLVIAADGAAEGYKALSNLAYDLSVTADALPATGRRLAALGIASSAAEASAHSRSRSPGAQNRLPRGVDDATDRPFERPYDMDYVPLDARRPSPWAPGYAS